MEDILHQLYDTTRRTIPPPHQLVCGAKYYAVLNTLGNVGVCANLESPSSVSIEELNQPDFSNYYHRVAVNAWINAHVNYQNAYAEEIDIFNKIPFHSYKSIVMVGYFESLIHKFRSAEIPISIFDLKSNSDQVLPIEQHEATIKKADIIIATSTSLANNTLSQIIKWKRNDCKFMMLGPSTPLSEELAIAINADYLFGSIFDQNPKSVLDLIKNGGDTKTFLPFMKKVYLAPIK
ncbi:Rossmann-like domain-containing protein [Williamwhitmania taraxaci]|uniref:Putative heavy-metal chelation n=1 Tax=Williamwhitmania taraxaci TaxID=1640674 RepID=A0A1G6N8S4_9BACT|nr:DUF364 domain-containing protein [Williamwhitmania taraxaci]SDC64262.1 Putative heavy-metal chelation [Williamwhitmania taraxaci]